ncbi:aminotransferase class IV [Fibrella aquatilis]|uniref:branched-chain-amino-acid transaminase n=1 Tax=Fibrella aquatilis TaxID=2817059 RepID=A0A939K3Z9_9BACT|nr:aminotransferase class IV [Fibrella aquatilis]MBO0934870.1 aminotransferase class IV family protein [Fibrella aquatilis]
MPYFGYFNGTIQPTDQIGLGVTDLGLLRGFGLFDYFLTYNGQPFQWDWYWERFRQSAEKMTLDLPLTQDETHAILLDLLQRSGQSGPVRRCGGTADVAFRLVMTGGYSPDSISIVKPNLLILSEPIHPVPTEQYEHGIRVILDEYVRPMPEVKATDYRHVMMLAGKIREAGAQDVLYHMHGEISELSRSNLFLVRGNRLITPSRHILRGITRRTIMELARPDFEVEERPVLLSDLYDADEAFTTSSNKKVLPIVKIGDFTMGNGHVGPVSRELLARFRSFTNQ